jgi:tRNA(Arg) A34 adenosine deaminase TadA
LNPIFSSMPHPFEGQVIHIEYPPWVSDVFDWLRVYQTDEDRMRVAVGVAPANIDRTIVGPFGAAVFESATGRLVSVGMNSVVRLNNCILHAEIVAFMMAQQAVASYTLNAKHLPAHELYTSFEPCAMCLGATLWSAVRRVVYGATRADASRLQFDEGPVFPESYKYLEDRGLRITRGILRDEAKAVLESYRAGRGEIYNG